MLNVLKVCLYVGTMYVCRVRRRVRMRLLAQFQRVVLDGATVALRHEAFAPSERK